MLVDHLNEPPCQCSWQESREVCVQEMDGFGPLRNFAKETLHQIIANARILCFH